MIDRFENLGRVIAAHYVCPTPDTLARDIAAELRRVDAEARADLTAQLATAQARATALEAMRSAVVAWADARRTLRAKADARQDAHSRLRAANESPEWNATTPLGLAFNDATNALEEAADAECEALERLAATAPAAPAVAEGDGATQRGSE